MTDTETAPTIAQRQNLANLFSASGVYTRVVASPDDPEFTIDINFVSPVTFGTLTLTKVFDTTDYLDVYQGICLTVNKADGTPVAPSCTDATYGFDSVSDDAVADIVFNGLSGTTEVVSAQLTINTSNTNGGSNLSATTEVPIAQLALS